MGLEDTPENRELLATLSNRELMERLGLSLSSVSRARRDFGIRAPGADPARKKAGKVLVAMPAEMVEAIDAARNGESRAAWIREAVRMRLESGE